MNVVISYSLVKFIRIAIILLIVANRYLLHTIVILKVVETQMFLDWIAVLISFFSE